MTILSGISSYQMHRSPKSYRPCSHMKTRILLSTTTGSDVILSSLPFPFAARFRSILEIAKVPVYQDTNSAGRQTTAR